MSRKFVFVNEVYIVLVYFFYYKVMDFFDYVLVKYFKILRMLIVGDVFYMFYNWEENGDFFKESGLFDD